MKKHYTLSALIVLSILFLFSCHKDETSDPVANGGSNTPSLRTTVSGIVSDETNAPLTGVTVTAYGHTTTTSQYGTFVLKNIDVNKDRCILQFTKAGFFNRAHGFIASANTVNYVRIVLISNPTAQTLSASSGGTVSLADGSTINFQPNSFATVFDIAYTGTVNLEVKHLSPDDTNFGFMVPGGDLLGKDLNNKDVALYTYGMLGVILTGSAGETLQLANGTAATLTMPIATSQLSSAPATIPLWYFDEITSLWKEEGVADKVGNNYTGTVKHFSWWNCDFGGPRAYIQGKVVDCNGAGVSGVQVWTSTYGHGETDQNGVYSGGVLSGSACTVSAIDYNNFNSPSAVIPALQTNQVYTVPDLHLCAYTPCQIKGTITGCTGSAASAFVSVSWSGGFSYIYCMNGNFIICAAPNMQVTVNIYEGSALQTHNITTPNVNDTINIGNSVICSTPLSVPENSITVNCPPLNIINTSYSFDTTGYSGMVTAGHINANLQRDSNYLNIQIQGSSSGTYNFSSGNSISSYFPGVYVFSDSSSGGSINVTVENVGQRIKGTFNGTATIYNNSGGGPAPGYINGKFNVPRIQ